MSRHILAVSLLFMSSLAAAEVRSCDLPNNSSVQRSFGSRSSNAAFDTFGKNTSTVVKFNGSQGTFQRAGVSNPDSLTCIRYLTLQEVVELAEERNIPGLDVGTYFDTGICSAVIAADWSTGNTKGHVLWCVEKYKVGDRLQGVYWKSKDWEDSQFDGAWDGSWK